MVKLLSDEIKAANWNISFIGFEYSLHPSRQTD
jgi:hypothetical protein